MLPELFKRIHFQDPTTHECLVLFFDLENYSKFVLAIKKSRQQNQIGPLLHSYLNHIFADLNKCIHGGSTSDQDLYWLTDDEKATWEIDKDEAGVRYCGFAEPNHFKFQGDGALYVWERPQLPTAMLINRLLGLQDHFSDVSKKWLAGLAAASDLASLVPQKIRFGLSYGPLVRLGYWNNPDNTSDGKLYAEYVGYDVNLAARLEGFCKKDDHVAGIAFMASKRVPFQPQDLAKYHLVEVQVKPKGCENEKVFVLAREFEDYKNSPHFQEKFPVV